MGDSAEALPQVTITTPCPGRVSSAMFHFHATLPLASAFWLAVGGVINAPEVEMNIKVHPTLGDVLTLTCASLPGLVTETETNRRSGLVCASVGVTVGS